MRILNHIIALGNSHYAMIEKSSKWWNRHPCLLMQTTLPEVLEGNIRNQEKNIVIARCASTHFFTTLSTGCVTLESNWR